MANFWNSNQIEPKRQYRWILSLSNINTYTVKAAAKPKMQVGAATHKYLGHTFKYPGIVTWNDIVITLVDPVFPDASAIMVKTLQASGYALPASEQDAMLSLSKKASVEALGQPRIIQIDAEGFPVETWTLFNAWIKDVTFGATLNYTADALTDVKFTISYDWAEYEGNPESAGGPLKPIMSTGQDQKDAIATYRAPGGIS